MIVIWIVSLPPSSPLLKLTHSLRSSYWPISSVFLHSHHVVFWHFSTFFVVCYLGFDLSSFFFLNNNNNLFCHFSPSYLVSQESKSSETRGSDWESRFFFFAFSVFLLLCTKKCSFKAFKWFLSASFLLSWCYAKIKSSTLATTASSLYLGHHYFVVWFLLLSPDSVATWMQWNLGVMFLKKKGISPTIHSHLLLPMILGGVKIHSWAGNWEPHVVFPTTC